MQNDKIHRIIDFSGNVIIINEYTKTENADGEETRTTINEVQYDCTELPENIFVPSDAARHGIKQKLGDSTASMSAGKGFSVEERFQTIDEVWQQLAKGEWNKKATGSVAKADKENGKKLRAMYNNPETPEDQRVLLASIMGIEYAPLS